MSETSANASAIAQTLQLVEEITKAPGARPQVSEVGRVLEVGVGVAIVSGLAHALAEEMVVFASGGAGIVSDLEPGRLGVILLCPADGLAVGDDVHRTGEVVSVPVGDALLGRIVDLYVMSATRPLFAGLDPSKRNEEELKAGKEAYLKGLAQLEHFMDQGPCAVGGNLGYADCAMLPCLQLMGIIAARHDIADPYAGLPKLSAWWQHMRTLPASRGFIERYQAAITDFFQGRR